MMFWTDHDLSAWGWMAMVAGMVIFWGLLVGLTVALVRALNRPPEQLRALRPSPEQILAERFAGGEMDGDEYRRRLAALSSSRQAVNRP